MVVAPEQTWGDDKEVVMAMNRARSRDDGADRIIDSVAEAERTALEAVRRFLDTVNNAFPDVGSDGGARQRIIDSAFRMTDELVGTSNQFAHRLVKVGADAAKKAPAKVAGARRAARRTAAKKAPGRKAPAKRAAAKKAPGRKAPAKRAAAKKAPARKTAARKAPAKRAPAKKAAS
jgi:hypothetical protein